MAETVTIEGTVTPCVELRTGERRTVELTDRVKRLVRKGYITIVARHGDPNAEIEAAAQESPAISSFEQEVPVADVPGDSSFSSS